MAKQVQKVYSKQVFAKKIYFRSSKTWLFTSSGVQTAIFSQPKNGPNTARLFYSALHITCHANSIKSVIDLHNRFFDRQLTFYSIVYLLSACLHILLSFMDCKRRRLERSARFLKWQSKPPTPVFRFTVLQIALSFSLPPSKFSTQSHLTEHKCPWSAASSLFLSKLLVRSKKSNVSIEAKALCLAAKSALIIAVSEIWRHLLYILHNQLYNLVILSSTSVKTSPNVKAVVQRDQKLIIIALIS